MITQNDVQHLFHTDVYEADGTKIGSTGQVYLDRQSGNPAWVSVKTGLFGTKESLVPLQKATLSDDRIVVPFEKAQIKNAPRIEPDDDLSPAEEDELYRYYGFPSGDDRTGLRDDAATRDAGRQGGTYDSTSGEGRVHDDPMTPTDQRDVDGDSRQARLRRYNTGDPTNDQGYTDPERR